MTSRFEELPRTPLAHLPTPLEPMARLSEALAGPALWVKRDDCTGLGTGGNKTRKLEYLIGRAEAEGADTVITFGAVQSNHARQTAAACAARGLRLPPDSGPEGALAGPHLRTPGQRPAGQNVRCQAAPGGSGGGQCHLSGAEIGTRRGQPDGLCDSHAAVRTGPGHWAMPPARWSSSSRQRSGIWRLTDILHATSSAGTQSGLLAGLALAGRLGDIRVHGINVSEPADAVSDLVDRIGTLADEALSLLGADMKIDRDAILVDSSYLGDGYGMPTPATLDALRQVGGREGLLLDPVYSGKAMSGLIGKVAAGHFEGTESLVFLHTGGSASLPVYGEVIAG